jgi:F-type H+-transporting ATPase subunit b
VYTVTVALEAGDGLRVLVDGVDVAAHTGRQVGQAGETQPEEGPSPISIEKKELFWAGGAFLVFLALMRLYLVPKVKEGMEARYGLIRSELEEADDVRAEAQRELAEYQADVAKVRAEAATRIEAARHQLEGERAERLTQVNDRIAAQRAEAVAQAEAARAAARETTDEAVTSVVTRLVELSIGKRPDPAVVSRTVADVSGVEVTR